MQGLPLKWHLLNIPSWTSPAPMTSVSAALFASSLWNWCPILLRTDSSTSM